MLRYMLAGLFLVGMTAGCSDSASKAKTQEKSTTVSTPEGETTTTEKTTKEVEVETNKDNTTAEKELEHKTP